MGSTFVAENEVEYILLTFYWKLDLHLDKSYFFWCDIYVQAYSVVPKIFL